MNTYDRLYALVKEMDADLERVRTAVTSTANERHERPIRNDLGTVTVTGAGELVAVDLNVRALHAVRPAHLGQQLRDAILTAERHALTQREQRIKDAQRRSTT